jgi:hypothetical protein
MSLLASGGYLRGLSALLFENLRLFKLVAYLIFVVSQCFMGCCVCGNARDWLLDVGSGVVDDKLLRVIITLGSGVPLELKVQESIW